MKYLILFLLIIQYFSSCSCFKFCDDREAKRVFENFSREYTGLDTLIRMDGYYYHEDDAGSLNNPFIISNNGGFYILYYESESHNRIQERFRNDSPTVWGRGNYILSDDTINAR